ncbi:assimilatory sulfite reductase (NADPH) flavoprotein subunit [Desertibacillus haloalkaliphilus]|uniref:assimilatory sulfite reductase (NADPH) flavoprotein subunit n=1 Tax=Desertibacillus haloalkaliphilus TaxID=1328930 RepID=UPI001C25D673|nr:assimilatory sulfite reductase (NADPH) flavoprotein subunit [Desertibacillus haloalkaliphilus]MBU8905004.1 assimilatory sulfite reductase (NADPH) flavoprotein subunit [Desertibacillus haloalkaliphilus]
MQFQVINSPFNQEQAELLNRLVPTLTEAQKVWLSGYLAASQSNANVETTEVPSGESAPAQPPAQPVSKDVTILYGSQTGNAEGLAEQAGKTLEGRGFNVTVSSMSDFKPKNLKKLENLLIVVSTHGEGDPPDNALSFHEFLHGRRAPKLDGLRFSVLSLGDSSYEFFCQTGIDFDKRLEELGGKRLFKRVDCDVEFDEPAAKWIEGVRSELEGAQSQPTAEKSTTAPTTPQEPEVVYSRKNPFQAEVLENINLNGRGSDKETRHLELSLEGSGLSFEPGDTLGIFPENDPELVDLIIKEMKWDPSEKVTINKEGDVLPLSEALTSHFEITVLTKPLLRNAAEISDNGKLKELVAPGNEERLKDYLHGRDLLDFIRDFGPWKGTAEQFVTLLRKIPPRLYSIASSFAANPDEVHLTIGAVRYEAHGRERKGVCSVQCSERVEPGDTLPVYIQPNKHFNLPENPETPIIMVGPGTGVAPFRSFMQEREEMEIEGKSWMFFGDQHFVTDFLYQTEWQQWLKDGVLTRMDVAFSRDGDEKVYVQNRMQENSKELFAWLEEGAIVYVCGDKTHMARDVHQTLLEIIEKEGNMSQAQAEEYLAEMKQQKRYQRDIY